MAGLTKRLAFPADSSQLLRFLIAGVLNTAFAFAIYAAGLASGLSYQLASFVALVAGICSGFIIQGKVAFRARLSGRFLPFLALWVLLYLANIVLIGVFAYFGTDLYLAGLIAAVPVNAASYLALRLAIFAREPPSTMRILLLWCIALIFIARLHIVTHMSLNWDEFLNLSMLYDFHRGDMTEIFQTAFVHLFHWLPQVSPNEVDQLIAARLVMLACVALTSIAIFHAACRFMDVDTALVAVLAFNCFGASLLYATDVRTDSVATAAMTGAIALATHRRATPAQMIVIGGLVALGGVLTIKSIFLVPTIAILVLANAAVAEDRVRAIKALGCGAAAGASIFAALLALHAASLGDTASAVHFLGRTGAATLLTGDYRLLMLYWLPSLIRNLGFLLLVVIGLTGLAIKSLLPSLSGIDRLKLATFALPLLVPVVYSEVYPYFHPFLIAPASVVAGIGFTAIPRVVKPAIFVLLFIGAANPLIRRIDDRLSEQRETLAVIHRLFPDPVTYIDHTSMVSSFPKKGFFMSRWGVADYRKAGRPVMAEIIQVDQPQFLLETRAFLAIDRITPAEANGSEFGLFAADVKELQNNYLRYWGPLFLPGKTLNGVGQATIAIGGTYRVQGQGLLFANGHQYSNGDTVRLTPGEYAYSSDGALRLVWAAPPPPDAAPPTSLFSSW